MHLLDYLSQNRQIQDWQSKLNQAHRSLLVGLSSSIKSSIMATAYDEQDLLLIVTDSQNEAENLASDLISLLGEDEVYTFIADDTPLAEFLFASAEKRLARLDTLEMLASKAPRGIIVANVAACQLHLPSANLYRSLHLSLQTGKEYSLEEVQTKLQQFGYQKVSQVSNQGEFSIRGDILDIFERRQENPYRLEFFGDEIDGIRIFDAEKQTSIENVEQIHVSPFTDLLFEKKDFDRAVKKLEKILSTSVNPSLNSYLEELVAAFRNYEIHSDSRKFLSFLYEKEYGLLDYLPSNTPIFFDEYQKIIDKMTQFNLATAEMLTDDLQANKAVSSQKYFLDVYSAFRSHKPSSFFSNFQRGLGNLRFNDIYQFNQYAMQDYFGQLPLLVEEIRRFIKTEQTVLLQMLSTKSLHTLQSDLQSYQLDIPYQEDGGIEKGKVQFILGGLSKGFHFVDEQLVVITEQEIYQKKAKKRIRRQNISNAERLKDYNELEVGDYVVHNIHGIGKYLGLETIEISGIHRDYLTIQYQNSDRISIPVDQIHLLSKYLASDGKTPKINKLNDGRFQKTKQKVAKQVEDIADDLIQLYAERASRKGFAFAADSPLQEEFDQAFPYVETEDQLRSIEEIKTSMQSDQPMDRLLVGDVGFGKTEVAMRAAFKAVENHKQVAVLVPTTVLAQQHYATFKSRFLDFPVNIDVLSRFKSKAEQEKTLESLKKGQVDIIIGTHRLLSQDVEFTDLGLIIIDEEQRFGVKHKEKLKELKTKVDVLTLTATPIPRTLHMSMLGIRDLSVIETPPTNRYPVQTYVMENNPTVIREAIIREMDRGGQVYYLYNRVDTIEQKVSELQELVPEARIGYVHGQMTEVTLENRLLDFIEGDYDVLVTTTIIETGVDIPNANTLFIENADYMGLSTLYQLRGRVGRSNRIAYAYLMYRPDKSLTEVSEKRLEAIKGFTELGSGFKIAMRDLSIRGAGNILGSSQSGFIDSVGFEMYSQLLEEAIEKKQGKEKIKEKSNAEIQLMMDAYLPSDYIQDERQKIEIYKKIRDIDNTVNYQDLQEELIDRFGDYPDPVAYLLEIALVKSFMDKIFVESVLRKQNQVSVLFENRANQFFLTQDYFQALSMTDLKARIGEYQGRMEVTFDIRNKKDYQILENLSLFAGKMVEIKEEKQKEN